MFEAVDKKVLTLKRTKIGKLVLDPELELGTYRELTEGEVELLLPK
jgi:16S rRNA pseudouridine516 synthase